MLKSVSYPFNELIISNYIMFMFKTRANQSYSPSKISQSINVEWCTCDRNCQQFFKSEQEKLRSFFKAEVLIEKNLDMP